LARNFDTGPSDVPALPETSFVVNGTVQTHNASLAATFEERKWCNGISFAATFEGEFSNTTARMLARILRGISHHRPPGLTSTQDSSGTRVTSYLQSAMMA
jgi:hypothetical protein